MMTVNEMNMRYKLQPMAQKKFTLAIKGFCDRNDGGLSCGVRNSCYYTSESRELILGDM